MTKRGKVVGGRAGVLLCVKIERERERERSALWPKAECCLYEQ